MAMHAIPSIPLSSHQSLKECAHVISLSCNLLGLQLKARIEGPRILALRLEPPAISSKTDVMTDAIIKCTPQPKVNLCRALNKYFVPLVQHLEAKSKLHSGSFIDQTQF